jgi:hypothetical protein
MPASTFLVSVAPIGRLVYNALHTRGSMAFLVREAVR